MKSGDRPISPKGRPRGRELDSERLAVEALSFLASDEERLGDFLAATGLTRDTLRDAAGEPGFLTGVLGHVGADEALLLAFASHQGTDPEQIGRAIARARRDPDPSP